MGRIVTNTLKGGADAGSCCHLHRHADWGTRHCQRIRPGYHLAKRHAGDADADAEPGWHVVLSLPNDAAHGCNRWSPTPAGGAGGYSDAAGPAGCTSHTTLKANT